ncbi:MAG: RpiB/LacA/LacB family sugar-phosphate isomerase [Tannerella sp.]|jgi:ribose 5-phosphate isomerase B|nr:RpiB/LacA/LacB family sugar-phosphate isomerase [Tannerella sp.]
MNFANTTIGLASDHTGVEYKDEIKRYLESRGLTYEDFGAYSTDNCNYPDFAHKLGKALSDRKLDMGIALCGTGNGMAITLNKYPAIRAGLAWSPEIAALVSAHNKANVLVIPARFIPQESLLPIVAAYLDTPFEGGRHQVRIDGILEGHE